MEKWVTVFPHHNLSGEPELTLSILSGRLESELTTPTWFTAKHVEFRKKSYFFSFTLEVNMRCNTLFQIYNKNVTG